MATAGIALLVATADYQFSQIYRNFGRFLEYQRKPNSRLWFTGEWGFRTYLEQIGGEELGRRDPRPKPGDWAAIPTLATPYRTLLSESIDYESIIMVAPSQVQFTVPAPNRESTLIFLVGLPYWEKSDGLDFEVTFESDGAKHTLISRHISPECGRTWAQERISLGNFSGSPGLLTFGASVDEGGNATADWLAIAQARIDGTRAYDLLREIPNARIKTMTGIDYHTESNRPVFRMAATLEQPAVLRRLTVFEYYPSIPLRLLNATTHAGFWSMGWGSLPFTFAHAGAPPVETISLYEVIRTVDSYGASQPSWYPE